MDDKPSIWDVIDDRLDCLEMLAKRGNEHAVTALRRLAEFQTLMHELGEGETVGWAMLAVVEPLIDSLVESAGGPWVEHDDPRVS